MRTEYILQLPTGEQVGSVGVMPLRGRSLVHRLWVHPDYRGLGLARRLLGNATEDADREGVILESHPWGLQDVDDEKSDRNLYSGLGKVPTAPRSAIEALHASFGFAPVESGEGFHRWVRQPERGDSVPVELPKDDARLAAIQTVKPHMPWADLMGLTPQESSFQRTHPLIRQNILNRMRGNSHPDTWARLNSIHQVQSRVDAVRARQGRPSPYAHPSKQQPWGNPSPSPTTPTVVMPRVAASEWWRFSASTENPDDEEPEADFSINVDPEMLDHLDAYNRQLEREKEQLERERVEHLYDYYGDDYEEVSRRRDAEEKAKLDKPEFPGATWRKPYPNIDLDLPGYSYTPIDSGEENWRGTKRRVQKSVPLVDPEEQLRVAPWDKRKPDSPMKRLNSADHWWKFSAAPDLTIQDYEGEEGNRSHITRNETGMVPVSWLLRLRGAAGEMPGQHRNYSGERWDHFKQQVAAGAPGYSEPIFITVDHNGEPVISEGNHRRDAYWENALAAGISRHDALAPVNIRYFGHAERQGTVGDRAMRRTSAWDDNREARGDRWHEYRNRYQPDTLHRGVYAQLDDDIHDYVHNETVPVADRARVLLDNAHRFGYGLGMHWTPHLDIAERSIANAADEAAGPWDEDDWEDHSEGSPSTDVIFHIRRPAQRSVVRDPKLLEQHGVGYEFSKDEDETPIKPGAPVHVTGISWRPHDAEHPREAFEHHDFERSVRHEAAVNAEGFPNPYHGNPDFGGNPDFSHTWFHGTKGEPEFGSRRGHGDFAERLALPPDERIKGSAWPQPNQMMGVHLSPLHEVAHKFAWGSKPSAIVHVKLNFDNPAHYPTERHLDYAVADWASKNFPEWHDEKLNRDRAWNYSDNEGTHADFSQVPEGYGNRAQDVLQWHPYLPEIIKGFHQHLAEQGHHGITYGNEVEGPYISDIISGGRVRPEGEPYPQTNWPWGTPKSISAIAQPKDIRVTDVERVAASQATPGPDEMNWEQAGRLDEPEEVRDRVLAYHRANGGAYPQPSMRHEAARNRYVLSEDYHPELDEEERQDQYLRESNAHPDDDDRQYDSPHEHFSYEGVDPAWGEHGPHPGYSDEQSMAILKGSGPWYHGSNTPKMTSIDWQDENAKANSSTGQSGYRNFFTNNDVDARKHGRYVYQVEPSSWDDVEPDPHGGRYGWYDGHPSLGHAAEAAENGGSVSLQAYHPLNVVGVRDTEEPMSHEAARVRKVEREDRLRRRSAADEPEDEQPPLVIDCCPKCGSANVREGVDSKPEPHRDMGCFDCGHQWNDEDFAPKSLPKWHVETLNGCDEYEVEHPKQAYRWHQRDVGGDPGEEVIGMHRAENHPGGYRPGGINRYPVREEGRLWHGTQPTEAGDYTYDYIAPRRDLFQRLNAAIPDESGLKAAGIAIIAMDTGRVLMQQRALNPLMCPCGQGVTWDEQNGYQHEDGSVSHDGEFYGSSVSDLLDQGHPQEDDDEDEDGLAKEAALEHDPNEGTWEFPGGKLDPGESPRDAAVREFQEEVGQPLPPGVFVGAWVSPGGVVVTASTQHVSVQPGDTNFGYGSGHTAPTHSEGYRDTLDNMDDMMPDYLEHPEWYGNGGGDAEWEAHRKARAARGNPDKKVWIYRAVPHGISKIYGRDEMSRMLPDQDPNNLAEWVSTSKTYAQEHAAAESCPKCGGRLQVIAARARAGDLVNEGYPTEFGYQGAETLEHAGANRVYKTKCPAPRMNDAQIDEAYHATLDENGQPTEATEAFMRRRTPRGRAWRPSNPLPGHYQGAAVLAAGHGHQSPGDAPEELAPIEGESSVDAMNRLRGVDTSGWSHGYRKALYKLYQNHSFNLSADDPRWGEEHPQLVANRAAITQKTDRPKYPDHTSLIDRVRGGEDITQRWVQANAADPVLDGADPRAMMGDQQYGIDGVCPVPGRGGPQADYQDPTQAMVPRVAARKGPVYKGFIYLIQRERDIDLTKREHANPDDPDGDMTEQSAWWDIDHAKKNPALRKEVKKDTPWAELELWADKSVRSNREVTAMVQKLAMPYNPEYIGGLDFKFDDDDPITPDSHKITAVDADGNPHGSVRWYKDDQEYPGEVSGIWVHHSVRRNGLALELLRRAKQLSQERGWAPMVHDPEPKPDGEDMIYGIGDRPGGPVLQHEAMGMTEHDADRMAFRGYRDEDKPVYLRFGKWPANEQSMNHITGIPEYGVSVYDLDKRGEPIDPDSAMTRGVHEYDPDECGEMGEYGCETHNRLDGERDEEFMDDTQDMLRGHLGDARREHNRGPRRQAELVTGTLEGFGHDDEPLLRNVQRVGHWPCDVHKFIPGMTKTPDGGFSHEGRWENGKVNWCEHPDHDEPMEHEAVVKVADYVEKRLPAQQQEKWMTSPDNPVYRFYDTDFVMPRENHQSQPMADIRLSDEGINRDRDVEEQPGADSEYVEWNEKTERDRFKPFCEKCSLAGLGIYGEEEHGEEPHQRRMMSAEQSGWLQSHEFSPNEIPRYVAATGFSAQRIMDEFDRAKAGDESGLPREPKLPNPEDRVKPGDPAKGENWWKYEAAIEADEYEPPDYGQALPVADEADYHLMTPETAPLISDRSDLMFGAPQPMKQNKQLWTRGPMCETCWMNNGDAVSWKDHSRYLADHGQERHPFVKIAKVAMPTTQDVPHVNKVIRSGEPGDEDNTYGEGARVHDVSLPSGDWIAKSMQHRHLMDPEYQVDPEDVAYFQRRAAEDADMEEFASRYARAISDPEGEALAPEAIRGQKASDPTPTTYVRKYPQFHDFNDEGLEDEEGDYKDSLRGKQMGYFHATLGEGDHADFHNMGLVGDKGWMGEHTPDLPIVSIDHTHSSLPLYADALAHQDENPEEAKRLRWHHEFDISPFGYHYLARDANGNPGRRKSNPLGPGDHERLMAATETLRPWAKERGREDWLDALQKRQGYLGKGASGTESIFPYQMPHEQGEDMEHVAAAEPEWWRAAG